VTAVALTDVALAPGGKTHHAHAGAGLAAPSDTLGVGDFVEAELLGEQQVHEQLLAVSALARRDQLERGKLAADDRRLSSTVAHLASIRAGLSSNLSQLHEVRAALRSSHKHLVDLENRAGHSSVAPSPGGFQALLKQVDSAPRISEDGAQIGSPTGPAWRAVARELVRQGDLERRDWTLTNEILAQRRHAAAKRPALLRRQRAEASAQNREQVKLGELDRRLAVLQAQERETATQVSQDVGGIAIDPGGSVQPPAGAPLQVRQIIAAGNAIATLPYIWGGGHASFLAAGYDCSGSVSYALAAAGLLSSPEVAGDFESYGDPGPGRWVTIYANSQHVWMEVAGWRFDTVALAQVGTRWSRWGGEFDGYVVRHPPGL
jgi:hypothetical protein